MGQSVTVTFKVRVSIKDRLSLMPTSILISDYSVLPAFYRVPALLPNNAEMQINFFVNFAIFII